jgi:hypothetical protein
VIRWVGTFFFRMEASFAIRVWLWVWVGPFMLWKRRSFYLVWSERRPVNEARGGLSLFIVGFENLILMIKSLN